MDIKPIDDSLAVSPQIMPADIPKLAQQGFKSVICNRPDGEAENQPSFADIREAAAAAGLECRYLPVTAGNVGDSDVAAFEAALQSLPKPALAYCRTGTRSALLWSLDQLARGADLSALLKTTANAGYDLSAALRK
jgi:sulfide:quinone oxidoreductase